MSLGKPVALFLLAQPKGLPEHSFAAAGLF